MSDFYYSDSYFQLELNLQETRRELIALIEACELKDSAIYCKTECFPDTEHKDNDQSNVPPAVDLLPKPKWELNKAPLPVEEFKYDVQSWLKMGSLNYQLNSSDYTRTTKTVNFRKTPSKMAVKPDIESPGKEFCLKFVENTYNLDFVMKTNIDKNGINSGKITVDAFFQSFKDAKSVTKATNMPFDIVTKSSNTGRDYAYF